MEKINGIVKDLTQLDLDVVKRIEEGRSNKMYLLKDKNNKYFTFRIPTVNSSNIVNRIYENNNLEAIRNLNINSNVLYFDSSNGYKMSEYIKGTPLNQMNDLHLNEVSSILHLIHKQKSFNNDFNILLKLNDYEKLNKDRSKKYYELKEKFVYAYRDYLSIDYVPCHNDAQKANFIYSDTDKLYLLDWEFSGNNDPFYDLACFGSDNEEDSIKLLEVYLNRKPTKDDVRHLFVLRMYQALQWYNIAAYKNNIGLSKELNINFNLISKNFLELANKLYEKYVR